MTNTFDTSAQECKATNTTFHVEKPCEGSNVSVSLSTQEPTYFDFGLADIQGMQMLEGGMLLITFLDGQTLTIDNYVDAMAGSQFQDIELNDGEVINLTKLAEGLSPSVMDVQVADADGVAEMLNDIVPASGAEFMNLVSKPNGAIDTTALNYSMVEGEAYVADFNQADIESTQLNDAGQLVISFNDGTQTILNNFANVESAQDIPQMTLADGSVINVTDLLSFASQSVASPVVADDIVAVAPQAPTAQDIAAIEPAAGGNIAQTLAAIEPAAGAPAGALGNTGAAFGSNVDGATVGNNNAIGAIAPTAQQFGQPPVLDDPIVFAQPALQAARPNPPIVIANTVSGPEDSGINLGVFAQSSNPADSLTIVVSDILSGWTPDLTDPTTANGTFDAVNGTWTTTLNPGQSLLTGPVFVPPLHSDVDMQPTVTVTQTDSLGATQVTVGTFDVIVDAVADPVNLTATNVNGFEDNPVALNVQTSLIDTDGSENITSVTITGVPAGFTLNNGVDNGNGTWTVAQVDLPTLELTAPTDYSGTVTLGVTVVNQETPSDQETNLGNNNNTTSTPFDVTFSPVPDAPSLTVNNPIVKEDGTIDLNVSATLEDTDGSETLTVTITNLDSTWGVATGANNGTYDANTGTWTITMPAGQSYSGALTLTPPANFDGDMTNIQVAAQAVELDGSVANVSTLVDVLTDAVADMPTLTTSGVNGIGGSTQALNITNALTDTDGSESLGDVTISGLPAGFSLSAGTDNGNGSWSVPQAGLAGLQLNTPANFVGNFDLTVSVTSTDTPTDTETDFTDNTATVTNTLAVSLQPANANPPSVNVGGTQQVLEDGTVLVNFSAALSPNASPTEVLTVTVSGINSTWTINTGVNNGTYDANTGVWTITMPAGQDYTGGLTFTPPADSDADMTGINVNATATQPGNNSSSSADALTQIIVDAVADTPTIDAGNVNGVAGSSVALNITNALTDTDGSESLGDVTISGLPAGYSLSAGTDNGNGTWTVSQGDLGGLQLNIPAGGSGTFNLVASVATTESVTDTDFNLNNNTATNSDTLTVSVTNNVTPPTVNIAGVNQVLEDGSVFVAFDAALNGNDPTEVLSVTLNGIDPSWTITTGQNNGTYDANTGTWTITMPAGQAYNGGLTFYPPANSDVDMTGLSLVATATQPQTNTSVNNSAPSSIVVDAVADAPTLDVNNANGLEGQSIALSIASGLTDTDGSEVLSVVTVSGVPAGFSLNNGTDLGNGSWTLTTADLNGLRLNTPQNFNGSVPLTVSVTSTEQVTDTDFNLNNNVETTTKVLNVVIADTANPPTLTVDGTHQVLEDNSVFVPFAATISGDPSEILTVTVSGINPTWTITNTDGTYNANTGTWTITMPAGQNYNGGLTFAPPANSDVDMSGINVTASVLAPSTNTTSSITEVIQVITDAVADMPTINAGADASVTAGQPVALNVSNALTDTDGSEMLGDVTIAGVPNGYSLSAGTDNGNGTWTVTQAQLNGLQLNTPANGTGNVTLTMSVTSTESISDNEFNLNNNTATNSDSVSITVNSNSQPPSIVFGDGNAADVNGSAVVLEDGSVFVPIVATINGTAPQQLTVEVANIPSTWGINNTNGVYNPATGTWLVTVPAGQNYNGGLTFTPPTNSDVDLTGLNVSVTSTNTVTNQTQTTTVNGVIVVDAVADQPNLSVNNVSIQEGVSDVKLNISTSPTDTDGSESISKIVIDGVPAGFTLNNGTALGSGSWELNTNDLNNLCLVMPNGQDVDGTYNLTVTSYSTETPSDLETNLNNNVATTTQALTVVIADNVPTIATPPVVVSPESTLGTPNVIGGQFSANVGVDGPGVFCAINNSFNSSGDMAGGNLTSGGVAVTVNVVGNTYFGTANGVPVFELEINPNGSYTFEQIRPLDHNSATNPNEIINLNFGVCVTDSDGSVATTVLTVQVRDTGPVANNDVVTMWSCDWATIGNVITNHNQDNNGADSLSAEGPTKLTSVTANGETFEFVEGGGQAMIVHGNYGCIIMFTDGSYTYISGQAQPLPSHQENFGYTLKDADGDTNSANLHIDVITAAQSGNSQADYGNQVSGTNTFIGGQAAYQTTDTDGEMVFGWTANDILLGNIGNDAIFGWDGNDTLYGGAGNDALFGENGNNTLYGGSDADIFGVHIDKAYNNNVFDTIMDFNLSEGDVIELTGVITGFNATDDVNDFVRIVMQGNDAVLQVNSDGNGNDFFNVATIKDHAGLNTNNLNVQDLFDKGHIDVY